ncbi:MAG TPA: HAD family hydrolase [Propionicimonas sp.]|jgi:phosphoglycolate phosphatase
MSTDRRAGDACAGVIFDLDGTLVDSRECGRVALRGAIRSVLGERVAEPTIDLSLPLDAMLRTALPGRSPVQYADLGDAFRREYDDSAWQLATPFPGAKECLDTLVGAGIRVFVVTNKRESAARRVLHGLGLDFSIEDVFGQPDHGPGVSKEDLARRCLSAAGLTARLVVAVGDSDQDAQMARALRLPFIAVVGRDGPLSPSPTWHGSVRELWELPDLVGVPTGRYV